MDKFIHFDTSIGSLNIGDQIINECFEVQMKEILSKGLTVKYPTHTPTSHAYQNTRLNRFYRYCESCKYKFISGTNIVSANLFEPWPNWNVNLFNCKPYKDVIFVGVGKSTDKDSINLYTRLLYKRILSKQFIHSTRDQATEVILKKYGFQAINTGCVTLWSLTNDHCKKIPTHKAPNVIFTLTDYQKNPERDIEFINCLRNNYKTLRFWVQGSNDYEYLMSLPNVKDIEIIPPSLNEYRRALDAAEPVDYVGTRLHAGIYAMNRFRRSIIINVDNRARDMGKTYNLNTVERNNILDIVKKINSSFVTNIKIDEKKINLWKNQFK